MNSKGENDKPEIKILEFSKEANAWSLPADANLSLVESLAHAQVFMPTNDQPFFSDHIDSIVKRVLYGLERDIDVSPSLTAEELAFLAELTSKSSSQDKSE